MADVKSFAVAPTDGLEVQVRRMSESVAYRGCKIRVMPDGHPGKGAVVGSTIEFDGKVVPDTVGVDVGCRVSIFRLPGVPDFEALNRAVRKAVPAGPSVRGAECVDSRCFPYEGLACWGAMSEDERMRARLSMGSMGGGNHFIAVEVDDDTGECWLAVHCGSRSLGLKCAGYHQAVAEEAMKARRDDVYWDYKNDVRELRDAGTTDLIQGTLDEMRREVSLYEDMGMAYLDGEELDAYLGDMGLLTRWTWLNHRNIFRNVAEAYASEALSGPWDLGDFVTCQHNYVDVPNRVIRKGAISAMDGELGLVPLNMRDGMLVVRGKGNRDWNMSLPHGAGRALSRSEAFKGLTMGEYADSMAGVFSTTVNESTLDEAPMAYKPWEAIADAMGPNASIVAHLREAYNFKDDTQARRGRR